MSLEQLSLPFFRDQLVVSFSFETSMVIKRSCPDRHFVVASTYFLLTFVIERLTEAVIQSSFYRAVLMGGVDDC